MTLVTKTTDKTIIYSKNNCQACRMTKIRFDALKIPYEEINIEESGHFQEYANWIKEEMGVSTLPFILPPESLGVTPWAGFQPQNVTKLASN